MSVEAVPAPWIRSPWSKGEQTIRVAEQLSQMDEYRPGADEKSGAQSDEHRGLQGDVSRPRSLTRAANGKWLSFTDPPNFCSWRSEQSWAAAERLILWQIAAGNGSAFLA